MREIVVYHVVNHQKLVFMELGPTYGQVLL